MGKFELPKSSLLAYVFVLMFYYDTNRRVRAASSTFMQRLWAGILQT